MCVKGTLIKFIIIGYDLICVDGNVLYQVLLNTVEIKTNAPSFEKKIIVC